MSDCRLLLGDCLDVLRTLDAESVHCCVTSPPYWGLRDYGTAAWVGGEELCDHVQGDRSHKGQRSDRDHTGVQQQFRDVCGKCGARRVDQQIGLEQTPEQYVARLVEVFREVRRVLRDDGTLWLNLGDSYTAGAGSRNGLSSSGLKRNVKDEDSRKRCCEENKVWRSGPVDGMATGLKPKDLVGIPWRVAFALQSDGWWLRQDIIWHKPNPMPESVQDRCTKAHEYLFLLSKRERYYYDAEAIAEPFADERRGNPNGGGHYTVGSGRDDRGALKTGVWNKDGKVTVRNRRSVWTVATQPYSGAHFATFPPRLIEPCILAGCPAGGTVLDPFNGAGTTGLVALENGRGYVGIELNPAYMESTRKRLDNAQRPLPFVEAGTP